MSVFYEENKSDQEPDASLSKQEQALLKAHLDQEYKLKWRQMAGAPPKTIQSILAKKKWIWLLVFLFLTAAICWQAGWFSSVSPKEHPIMASRTDLLDYPFDNVTVRGMRSDQNQLLSAKALEAYRAKDFESAIQSAGTASHFFKGVCWLQLKNPQKALDEFEQAPILEQGWGEEFYYYKAVAYKDLGRVKEANNAFQLVLDSKTVREPFRSESRKQMKH